ncbi:hypothetical protein K353_02494 [Kitasatospora sp. SolWspMP-SS2h]|uniref:hypothetical protein n=1 Tax=Kitasatospora sp. SolWspMP-SS2h TaxID=1305729 RepID=UPI000DB9F48E|nr:hypothetical protein [Kitasatospora sp. SolWspMP-SS2h]RAJ42817.1 hypothetical protein K353_02494 [Kitasatospora sp. SolWspMP-SS2h]
MSSMSIPLDQSTGLPVGTDAVFLTLGSAMVALFYVPDERIPHNEPAYRWACMGCWDGSRSAARTNARNTANTHASECRAIPMPQAPGA